MGYAWVRFRGVRFMLALAVAVGLLVFHTRPSLGASTPDAASAVDSFIMSHDHGCGRVKIIQTTATPTYSSEVIPSRPSRVRCAGLAVG